MNMKSMSMYSTQYLVGGSFCLNYCSNAAWHGVDQSVALLRVMRAQVALIVAFSSFCIVGLAYRIFLFTIPHRFSMGLRSGEFAGQLRTGIPWSLNQVLVALALCAGAKSCWKNEICISHKVGQQREAWSALKLPGIRLCWPWTSENTVDQHQQMTWHPKPSLTVETLHWTSSNVDSVPLLFSSRLWDLISKGNAKFTFIREHNFGPLSSSPVETLLTLSVVQEWLDTRNATAETMSAYVCA